MNSARRAAWRSTALAAALFTGLGAGSSFAAEWPQQRYDSTNSNYQRHESQLSAANVAQLTLLWSSRLGQDHGATLGPPTATDGKLGVCGNFRGYMTVEPESGEVVRTTPLACRVAKKFRQRLITTKDDGIVSVRRTGAERWRVDRGPGEAGYRMPTYYQRMLYAPQFHTWLSAIDAETGDLAWSIDTGGLILNEVAVSRGKIVASWWDSCCVRSGPHAAAYDAATGARLWTYDTGSVESLAEPAIAGSTALILLEDGHVAALSLADGTLRWKTKVGTFQSWTLAATDDAVYVAGTGMTKLDLATGQILWTTPAPGNNIFRILVANDVLYFYETTFSPSAQKHLRAVNTATGQPIPLGIDPLPGEFTPGLIVVDGRAFVTDNGTLYAYGLPPAR